MEDCNRFVSGEVDGSKIPNILFFDAQKVAVFAGQPFHILFHSAPRNIIEHQHRDAGAKEAVREIAANETRASGD
jgi:hypothetical protein